MRRVIGGLVIVLALGIFTGPAVLAAQQPLRMHRLGYLDSGSPAPGIPYLEALRKGLRDLGWVEGQNIALEIRYAGGKYDQLPQLAAELVSLKVELVFASTTPAALAAQHATATIPIVIGAVADPVGSGLVASLAYPGGNVTGWTHVAALQQAGKRLELLKEAVPQATRFAVLWNPSNPIHEPVLRETQDAARTLKVDLLPVPVRASNELEAAFSSLARNQTQALTVFLDGMFLAQRDRIVALAARSQLPVMYASSDLAEAGGLMAYGVSLTELYRRGASYIDKILRGAKPNSLPIEQPTRFFLVINLKTAATLNLKIPPSLLLRADQIIDR